MLKQIRLASLALLLACSAQAASAATVLSSSGGTISASSSQPIGVDLDPAGVVLLNGETSATITVSQASTMDWRLTDGGIRGDAFALFLNGVEIMPTSGNLGADTRGPGATAFFDAIFEDVPLVAGLNIFTVSITDACCSSGGYTFTYGAVEPVPLPAAGWLLLAGVGGIAAMKRRKG